MSPCQAAHLWGTSCTLISAPGFFPDEQGEMCCHTARFRVAQHPDFGDWVVPGIAARRSRCSRASEISPARSYIGSVGMASTNLGCLRGQHHNLTLELWQEQGQGIISFFRPE